MTVYVDEIFLVNLIMDWLILWITGNFAQIGTHYWRIGLAAALGAGYAVAVLFPLPSWIVTLPVKLGWSLCMLLVAYPFLNWKNYLKLIVYFYFISFVLGGASIAVMYILGEPFIPAGSGILMVEINFRLFWLAIAALLVVLAVSGLRSCLRQDLIAIQQIVQVTIYLGNRKISVSLLVDNGHSLVDPLSGLAVIIVEQQAMLSLFSESIQKLLETSEYTDSERLLLLAEQSGMLGRWRLIPYQAVGQQGLLLGIRPDNIVIEYHGKTIEYQQHVVALSSQPISSFHTYQGLFPPTLL